MMGSISLLEESEQHSEFVQTILVLSGTGRIDSELAKRYESSSRLWQNVLKSMVVVIKLLVIKFYELHYREKKLTTICCAIGYTDLKDQCTVHWSFKFWGFTFWNLSPEIKCRVTLTKVFLEPDFLPFRSVSFLQQTSL